MTYPIVLPKIEYSDGFQFPIISNTYSKMKLPYQFHRWGSSTNPFNFYHGFVDDFRLESIWRDDFKMIDRVMSGLVITPDFTVDSNDPLPFAFHQVWRSRVIGRFWQDHGIFVIPCLQWSNFDDNLFLFSGLEKSEVIAVRSPTRGYQKEWCKNVEQFLTIYKPKCVLQFGTKQSFGIWETAGIKHSFNLNLR